MNENYVFLMSVDTAVCDLIQQRLRDEGIESKIEDYNQNAFFSTYGGNPIIGKKIMVPELQLPKARELLETKDEAFGYEKITPRKKPLIVRVIVFIILISFFIGISLYLFAIIKSF